ncbi:hypothetical protein [Cytobacillus purgationiresistens]|uniref:Uncharacterized protein n=1 Tax=Cytobacillus purgationiresistens TaxID=863449 RepID=A0ABU0ADG6_9BACI|nr:hypothetical protein [Cytobacillus purgationiresistens]MDQ0269296.1 hypothetical protein [Cytobacillus purgationiresistens]
MLIKHYKGWELEKEMPNTFEDFFNRSEVAFEEDGLEKTLTITYVQYFEEFLSEFTPYDKNPLFMAGSREVEFKDIVAIATLLNQPALSKRKRIFVRSQSELQTLFKGYDFSKLPDILESIENKSALQLP